MQLRTSNFAKPFALSAILVLACAAGCVTGDESVINEYESARAATRFENGVMITELFGLDGSSLLTATWDQESQIATVEAAGVSAQLDASSLGEDLTPETANRFIHDSWLSMNERIGQIESGEVGYSSCSTIRWCNCWYVSCTVCRATQYGYHCEVVAGGWNCTQSTAYGPCA